MNADAFLKKVLWVKKRARRLRRAYPQDITSNKLAVFDANLDWINFRHPASLNTFTTRQPGQTA
ncbi:MAG: hypothetical protein CO065_07210 [Comamonadaceae bacterium CG_4_9_14_0_8_um_filter_57_21]|nr:MAG: hypothetical protein CO065_07210 [Comamonadaceae bacterium CG_4_9_14_0_8_um_filter_57_21]